MSVTITEPNADRAVEVRLSGKLHKEDYAHFVPEFERLVALNGKLRLLMVMKDFHGWDMGALWQDIKFDVKHFSDIERVAMVGDKTWEKGMAAFCKPFTKAKVRYFDESQLAEAKAWLAE